MLLMENPVFTLSQTPKMSDWIRYKGKKSHQGKCVKLWSKIVTIVETKYLALVAEYDRHFSSNILTGRDERQRQWEWHRCRDALRHVDAPSMARRNCQRSCRSSKHQQNLTLWPFLEIYGPASKCKESAFLLPYSSHIAHGKNNTDRSASLLIQQIWLVCDSKQLNLVTALPHAMYVSRLLYVHTSIDDDNLPYES